MVSAAGPSQIVGRRALSSLAAAMTAARSRARAAARSRNHAA
jgi:hypothetical protein